ncbi:hypothetical protein MNBD_GAMMA21-2371 [hydrothermal vent metagenome]|uniref:Carrier domain-containing protein n=1 Tax=hydrothermal vent metagenome TaxID=652676 RepID=A0A3B1B0L4_9ZZZZ
MAELTAQQHEVAKLLVTTLCLEEVNPEEIVVDEPLFHEGLGLDSIDALELAVAVSNTYGFQLRSGDQQNKKIFSSLAALTDHIEKNRTV